MARNSKLDLVLQERLVEAVRSGNDNVVAARAYGLCEGTFYRWLERGRDDAPCSSETPEWAACGERSHPPGTCPGNAMFREFREAIERAKAECEVHLVGLVTQAAGKDWRAAIRLLESKAPERWKATQRTELTGNEGRPVQVDVTDVRERILAQVAESRARLVNTGVLAT